MTDREAVEAVRERMNRAAPGRNPQVSERSPHFDSVVTVRTRLSEHADVVRIAFVDRRDVTEPRGVARVETWYEFRPSPAMSDLGDPIEALCVVLDSTIPQSPPVVMSALELARAIRLAGFIYADTTEHFTGVRMAPVSELRQSTDTAGAVEQRLSTPPAH